LNPFKKKNAWNGHSVPEEKTSELEQVISESKARKNQKHLSQKKNCLQTVLHISFSGHHL
jgi:hypothetical protein